MYSTEAQDLSQPYYGTIPTRNCILSVYVMCVEVCSLCCSCSCFYNLFHSILLHSDNHPPSLLFQTSIIILPMRAKFILANILFLFSTKITVADSWNEKLSELHFFLHFSLVFYLPQNEILNN